MTKIITTLCPLMSTAEKKESCETQCAWYRANYPHCAVANIISSQENILKLLKKQDNEKKSMD